MKARLTLAIVTRKRVGKLARCLASITKQTVSPNTVLIVDNDGQESAKKVCARFKKQLPIRYAVEKREGIPQARNKALNLCKTPLLGYVDDDCVLDKKWVESAQRAMVNGSNSYILGKSLLFNKKNLLAQAQFYRQNYWFHHELDGLSRTTSPFNLDTKNTVLKVHDLRKNYITFDQKLFIHPTGGHADTDLGFQLAEAGLEGRYEPKMIVYHEEVCTLENLFKKAYYRGKVGFLIFDKWGLKEELVFLPDAKLTKWLKRIKTWPVDYQNWTKLVKKGTLQKVAIFLLIKLYDRVYLQGFVNQAREMGKGEYIDKLTKSDKS